MDIVYTLIITGSLLFVAFVLWCACALADDFDEITEEQWEEFLEQQKRLEGDNNERTT